MADDQSKRALKPRPSSRRHSAPLKVPRPCPNITPSAKPNVPRPRG